MNHSTLYSALVLAFSGSLLSCSGDTDRASSNTPAESSPSSKPSCSPATLQGSFTYVTSGLLDGQPIADIGMDTFDGQGSVTSRYHDGKNGFKSQTHSYSVTEDCRGQVEFETNRSFDIFVTPDGKRFVFSKNDMATGTGFAGRESRASDQMILTDTTTPFCSLATLKGSYYYGQLGRVNGVATADNGINRYDGAGTVVKISSHSTTPIQGSYTLDAQCQGEAIYENGERYALISEPKTDRPLDPKGHHTVYTSTAATTILSGEEFLDSTAEQESTCSLATLNGSYTYVLIGELNSLPFGESGMLVSEGNGSATVRFYNNENQAVKTTSADYTLDSNCHGTLSSDGVNFNFSTYTDGELFYFSTQDESSRLVGGGGRRSSALLIPAHGTPHCTLATLKGSYSYSNLGIKAGIPFAESGIKSYDGLGGVTNWSSNSSTVDQGTYTVNEECLGSVTYPNGEIYTLFVAPDGSSLYYSVAGALTSLAGEELKMSSEFMVTAP